jgi:hypothetical protein
MMTSMYGPRRIIFHNKGRKTGIIAICGKHEGSTGGSWYPMGRYATGPDGSLEIYMVDDPFKSHDQQLVFVGFSKNRLEAKRMILTACQNNPGHTLKRNEYVDDNGKVQKGKGETVKPRSGADYRITVTSRTRAGKNGRVIICPICACSTPVYNFAWIALVCPDCKSQVSKTNWLISTRQGV